jgi:hypothetical protein
MQMRNAKNEERVDPFDPANLRLPLELIKIGVRAQKENAKKGPAAGETGRPGEFVMVPLSRHMQLAGAPSSVIWLAYHLHYLSWRAHGRPFRLANGALTGGGLMSRHTKLRALRELERRGWIKVQIEARKSPTVTLLGESGRP